MTNYLKRDLYQLSCSSDYKARFVAEYLELGGRIDRLREMIEKHEAGTLEFEPTCPIDLLKEQLDTMDHYMAILLTRAILECVNLDNLDPYIKEPKAIRMLPKHEADTCRVFTLSQYKFIDKGWDYTLIDVDGREFNFSHADENKVWAFVY